jgi:hypothetical protein
VRATFGNVAVGEEISLVKGLVQFLERLPGIDEDLYAVSPCRGNAVQYDPGSATIGDLSGADGCTENLEERTKAI